MNSKGILKLVASLVTILFIVGCAQTEVIPQPNPQTASPQPEAKSGTGRVVFTIADAAAEMESVTSIKVTVDSIKTHSSADGWVDVSSSQKTYDLLDLKSSGQLSLLADAELKAGMYDEVRLDISKVTVTDSKGEQEAKLPSGELKIKGDMEVKEDLTATASFDFVADESLHVTGNGKYVMAPVVKFETRDNANVDVKSSDNVKIEGGKIRTTASVGMDLQGNVGVGIKVPIDVDISIGANGILKAEGKSGKPIPAGSGRLLVGITDAAADMDSITSVMVTIDSVEVKDSKGAWITVSSEQKTYDLLKLDTAAKTELFAAAAIDRGVYNQIKLKISKVTVVDAKDEHSAKLPSSELKINGIVEVKENSTSTLVFDFIASDSLHVTGNGEFIMAPVIKIESRQDAKVNVGTNGEVEIEGGIIKSKLQVGTDEQGNVGVGLKIPKNAELSLENGKVKIKATVQVSV